MSEVIVTVKVIVDTPRLNDAAGQWQTVKAAMASLMEFSPRVVGYEVVDVTCADCEDKKHEPHT